VTLLEDADESIATLAATQLKHTLLVFDAFYDVVELHNKGIPAATSVVTAWADAEWYLRKPEVPDKITVTVYKVTGETNTDDLSPAQDAWSRPDVPLHALAMLKNAREGHFRAAGKLLQQVKEPVPTRLWVAPPTKMDEAQLSDEGYYSIFGSAGARTEMPGCSLCMGNQARVAAKSTVVSTSTRNFPNRLGQGAFVYLASAELAAICAIEGNIPTVETYLKYMATIDSTAADTYRYLNFDELPDFVKSAAAVEISAEMKEAAQKMSLGNK